jgi:hypothetical protein
MAVADIAYFGALASAARISTVLLLRRFFRGDRMTLGTSVPRHDAGPTPEAAAAGVHRPRAA